jgi:hypothetical protein
VNEEGGIVRGWEGVHPSMVVHFRSRGCTGAWCVNKPSERPRPRLSG